MSTEKNTFGDYKFEEWIPESVREIIRSFWGCFGRTYEDWLDEPLAQGVSDHCYYKLYQGFRMPNTGDFVEFILRDGDKFKIVAGRYVFAWNNIGRLIDADGNVHFVSTCDRWVKWVGDSKELEEYLKQKG